MSQDYNIYLHSSDDISYDNKTKPFSVERETPFKPSQSDQEMETSATETGSASLMSILPVVAVGVAAAKITNHVLTVGFSHLREYTGHYEYEMGFNNFKTAINHVVNPIGYLKQILHRDFQFRKENQRIAEDAKLIGTTIYSNTKLGV